MKTAKWIVRAATSEAEVWLYDEIGENWFGGGISAKSFIDELNGLSRDISTVRLRINSPGGDVFDAFAMYQALLRHPANVVAEIDALAASAASVIAMAGDTIRMADTSLMMIHEPWTFTLGNSAEHREQADLLDQVAGNILRAYARRQDVDAEAIRAAMAAETWYTAAEAKEAGLVDEIVDAPVAVAAKIPPGRYRNTPQRLAAMAEDISPREARRRLESAKRAMLLIEP